MEFDGAWLASELSQVLDGWDIDTARSVVAAIDLASSRAEIDEIIMNYMDGSSTARSCVYKFWDQKKKLESQDWVPSPPQQQQRQQQQQLQQPSGSSYRADHTQSSTPVSQKKGTERTKKTSKEGLPRATELSTQKMGTRGLSTGGYLSQAIDRLQEGEEGKKGRISRGKGKRRGGRATKADISSGAEDKEQLSVAMLTKKVANCLKCGKVYDFRQVTEHILHFLDTGGLCTFCGAQVNLHLGESSSSDNRNETLLQEEVNPSSSKEVEKVDEAEEKAIEFKNKLVDFDRNAEKRTAVIDDQSDFFEIETNVWLSDKERIELRDRQNHEHEIASQQKRQVRYTVDLVGRKVMIADEAKPPEELRTHANLAEAAAAATAQELPQGGGAGAHSATETAGLLGAPVSIAGGQALRKIKAVPNPSIPGPAPMFIPSGKENSSAASGPRPGGRRWNRGLGGRLQHEDIFAGFEEEAEVDVLFEDLASILNTQTDNTFDICPDVDDGKEAMPDIIMPSKNEAKISANVRMSNMLVPSLGSSSVVTDGSEPKKIFTREHLPPGMVLLKGWLSVEEQLTIVRRVRDLGVGTGGFYTPSYTGGATLNLKLMCLGKNWNLESRCYEDIRSSYDGASPPPIPTFLLDMVQRSLKDASTVWGNSFTEMHPNVCLCNFYTADGSLGLHQDKDEGAESCRRRIPVVSFSIGATGVFVFNKKQTMEGASSVNLESGDVLVFGGPSRMIYHGVREIAPDTMPSDIANEGKMRKGRLNLTFRQYID